jgi:hypothetical protein
MNDNFRHQLSQLHELSSARCNVTTNANVISGHSKTTFHSLPTLVDVPHANAAIENSYLITSGSIHISSQLGRIRGVQAEASALHSV